MYLKKNLNVAALNVSSNKWRRFKNNVYQLSFSKIARSGVNGNRIEIWNTNFF